MANEIKKIQVSGIDYAVYDEGAERASNKVALGPTNTTTQYPNAKSTYDAINAEITRAAAAETDLGFNLQAENQRAIAAEQALNNKVENKSTAYVIDYNDTLTASNYSRYFKPNGTGFASQAELTSYLSGFTLGNGVFSSSNSYIDLNESSIRHYIIAKKGYDGATLAQTYIIIKLDNSLSDIKTGDDIYVIEENVPDRWFVHTSPALWRFYAYDAKADLIQYQKKNDNSLETTDKTIVGAINEVNRPFIYSDFTLTTVDGVNVPDIVGSYSKMYAIYAAFQSGKKVILYNSALSSRKWSCVATDWLHADPVVTLIDPDGNIITYSAWNLGVKISAVPGYGTSTVAVATSSAAGTATTVSRSDHKHSISLATGDNNGQVKIAGTNISVKGLGSAAYKNEDTLIKYNDILMPTNPFGGKQLYINTISDAFSGADKRFRVTVTLHSLTIGQDGSAGTFPRIRSGASVTDDNYFEDGKLMYTHPASVAAQLFDGDYEGPIVAETGKYLKVRIMFGDNPSPSSTTSYFPGYPYGEYFLSFYYNMAPGTLSEYRVYNQYAGHTLGWKKQTATVYNQTGSGSSKTNYIEKFGDWGNYYRSCVEFIIYPKSSTEHAYLTEINYKLDRPNPYRDVPVFNKYMEQKVYDNILFYNNYAETAHIYKNGEGDFNILKEQGVPISQKYGKTTLYRHQLTINSNVYILNTNFSDALTNSNVVLLLATFLGITPVSSVNSVIIPVAATGTTSFCGLGWGSPNYKFVVVYGNRTQSNTTITSDIVTEL